jgi:uncharacterized protein (DUF2236 family)
VAERAGMFGPSSMMWRVNRELVVLLGGPAAGVLQVAHPQVARGVAAHSRFREDGMGRLRRTLDAVYRVAFGGPGEAEAVRTSVGRAHRAVRGEGYDAFDQGAQRWVLATLVMASATTYRRFVAPLEVSELDALVADYARFGTVFGTEGAPEKWDDFSAYWVAMLNSAELGDDRLCGEVARAIITPRRTSVLRLASPLVGALVAELVPEALQRKLHLAESLWRRPVWKTLDTVLPVVLPLAPSAWRFAPRYRKAIRRGCAKAAPA